MRKVFDFLHMCLWRDRCLEAGTRQRGWCIDVYGRDQDDGVEKLDEADGEGGSPERAEACLVKCRRVPNATGCELIWGQAPAQLANGCYVHTKPIASGNAFFPVVVL